MKSNILISCSIVTYKNNREILGNAIKSFLDCGVSCKLFIIDNSPTNEFTDILQDSRITYLHNPKNPGFGTSHNIGIKLAKTESSNYHLILNPDVFFKGEIIGELMKFMDANPTVGIVMPKILYPNNNLQRLAKLLPNPIDYLIRRFIPFKSLVHRLNHRYELHDYDYTFPIEAPSLSGCFMFARLKVLELVKGFDEKIFMYMEDNDLCRRVESAGYKTMIYPHVSVYHDHKKKSLLNFNNLKVYSKSGFYYFFKWGWIFDKKRRLLNKRTLKQINDLKSV